MAKKISNEDVLTVFQEHTEKHLLYFKDKGFRQYIAHLGTWVLISRQDVLDTLCKAIRTSEILKANIRVNNASFWKNFLTWYEIAEKKELTEIGRLLGFRNKTLNTVTLDTLDHSPDNYCFQAIDTNYSAGKPTEESLLFFFRLGSYDTSRINLIRGLLKLAITGDQSKQIIPFLCGGTGSGKTTFFSFLKLLVFGNCVDMSLSTWSTQFGKSAIIGASVVIFDDVSYDDLRNRSAADLKKFSSGSGLQIDRKNLDFVTTSGGLVFMSGNKNFNYKAAPGLITDEGWLRRLLVVPIKERVSNEPFLKVPVFEQQLLADAPSIIRWALAIPDDIMVKVGEEASRITQALNSDPDSLLNNIYNFLMDEVRLDPSSKIKGGHGPTSPPETLQGTFLSYCARRELTPPKKRGEFQSGLKTVFRQLEIDRVVKVSRGKHGWEYSGLTLLKNQGSPIIASELTVLSLLRDFPICTMVRSQKQKPKSFEFQGVSTNQDLREKFNSPTS